MPGGARKTSKRQGAGQSRNSSTSGTQKQPLLRYTPSRDPSRALVRLGRPNPNQQPLSPYITGKFCEHLAHNIYQGMHAQILMNPTFAEFAFGGLRSLEGGAKFQSDETVIQQQILKMGERFGWPQPEQMIQARQDGLAMFWIKQGPRERVRSSPDAAPHRGRAQRVEASAAGQGIAQWIHLPLHRVSAYEFRLLIRSPDLKQLNLILTDRAGRTVAKAPLKGLSRQWGSCTVKFQVRGATRPDDVYKFALLAPAAGQWVIARAMLYPADHLRGADPDVVRLLKQSRLPILRWPGGNFVSGYHWEDGVGPMDQRPTLPNPAWGGLEPNFFGTHEFVDFCKAVGCEPMICVNAGNGTPQEAARWVQYCNGSARTPMGRRRAANGRPKPFNIKFWEVGNELSGRHQVGWTTPAGYADRYREFTQAMIKADPRIQLIACGYQGQWNQRLFRDNANILRSVSDHILAGGSISPASDPLEVFTDFMAIPAYYEQEIYPAWQQAMTDARIRQPRLAITELQLFGRLAPAAKGQKVKTTPDRLVTPTTWAEAAYSTLVCHLALRLHPFVEMITHSATVNHGGGLRKISERVYANPCHYAHQMFAPFNGALPVPVDLTCGSYRTRGAVKRVPAGRKTPLLDVAAATRGSILLVSMVNKSIRPVRLTLDLSACASRGKMTVTRLAAEKPWQENTLAQPAAIVPQTQTVPFRDGKMEMTLDAFALVQLRIA